MSELQPILVPISQASSIISKCRRGIYELIATGQLEAVKSGRSTRIVYESLKQYAASLPAAKFTPQPGPKRPSLRERRRKAALIEQEESHQ
jgi:excisionase family DNA binding protein